MSDKHDAGGVTTTGHVWDDDLADFANQPPKWWMLGLTASAIWCVVYFLYYPSFPLSNMHSYFKGLGGWTAITEMEADKSLVDEVRGKYEAKLKDMTPAAILADSELTEYVTRSGKVLFGDNCAACHGTNGVGTADKLGFMAPILRDDDWLYGGKIGDIYTIDHRWSPRCDDCAQGCVVCSEIDDAGQCCCSSRQGPTMPTPLFAEEGRTVRLATVRMARAWQAMGSANLTDSICRFDCSLEGIKHTITYGVNNGSPEARVAVMPSFQAAGKLSDAEMKKLAVYVYKFGGGQPDAPAAK